MDIYHIMSSTLNILLNISEIAIITGDNTFKSKRDYLLDFWKKNKKDDFSKYQKLAKFVSKDTDEEVIKKIAIKNNIDISTDLKKCTETSSVCNMNEVKKIILDKVALLPENEKKDITKSIVNVTNTKFGIKNEHDVLKIYEERVGEIIIKDDIYIKKKIFESNDFNIYIGGKIDGINTDSTRIIEIKNRVNRLFYTLRDYEKVQIMCYIYLFGVEEGHLVEAFRKKDMTEINIIDVQYDKIYMEYIIKKIISFSTYYHEFIHSHEMKIKIMNSVDEINF